jgi:hypothetical protein
MFNCTLCNKKFNFESELIRHQNRKILCTEPKKEYKCGLCNVKFISPTEQNRHEKTNKHINKYYDANNEKESFTNYENIDKIDLYNRIKDLEKNKIESDNRIEELEKKIKNLKDSIMQFIN